MKFSIIIPTCKQENLIPCLESIEKYTDLTDGDIIVVANGYNGDLSSLKNCKVLSYPERIGYTKATNIGIKESKGDFVILLNDDAVLLEQEKDLWIKMLLDPFEDEKVGITGPMLTHCGASDREFIIFFCACIKREMFDKLGLLDEIFNPGFGEDADFSIKIQDAGYKMIQVPVKSDSYYEPKKMVGGFPIFHEGEITFKDVKGGNELLQRNKLILAKRYRKSLKLHLACGDILLPDYLNIDLYNPLAEFKMDVRDLSAFDDNSVDEILAVALFEHLNPFSVGDVLKEWKRVLKNGGKLILEMPNILEICKAFEGADKAKRYEFLNSIYGTTMPEYPHLFGWYPEILGEHLSGAGFIDIQFSEAHQYHWGINMRVEALKNDWVGHQIVYGNNYERYVAGKDDEIHTREQSRYKWASENMVGKEVLDLGCSSGYGLRMLPKDTKYTGYDYDEKVLSFARKEFPQGTFVQWNLEQQPIVGEWDTIICFECIEHLVNGKELAQELKRHAKVVLLSAPYKEDVGFYGPHHKLHHLEEKDFEGFEFKYLNEAGEISDKPFEGLNLMLMKYEHLS